MHPVLCKRTLANRCLISITGRLTAQVQDVRLNTLIPDSPVSRLLFITDRFPPDIGGLASSADRITKVFCQLGVEVDILTWSRSLQPGEVSLPEPSLQAPQLYRVGRYRHWDMTMPH